MITHVADLSAYQQGVVQKIAKCFERDGLADYEFLGLINHTSHYVFRVQGDVQFYGHSKPEHPLFVLSGTGVSEFHVLVADHGALTRTQLVDLIELSFDEQAYVDRVADRVREDLGQKRIMFVGKVDGANYFLFLCDQQLRAFSRPNLGTSFVISGNGVKELARLVPRMLRLLREQQREDDLDRRRALAEHEIEQETARVRAEILKKHGLTA